MATVYFISGLGADERVFQKLELPQSWHLHFIKWLTPQKEESLAHYATRIAALIDTSRDFVLVGLSFGGMVAIELSKIIQPKLIILISSIGCREELPPSYQWIGKTGIDKVVPALLLKKITPYTYWIFGTNTEEERTLLKQIIDDTSPHFLKWAIHEIVNWKQVERPANIVHIQGTKDRIFPYRYTKANIKIKDAGHLMVYGKAKIISEILVEKIKGCF